MGSSTARSRLRRLWTDTPLRRKALGIAALPFIPLLVGILLAVQSGAADARHDEHIASHREARILVQQLEKTLVDAETSVRGYLLTGEDNFLEHYRIAVRALPEIIQSLEANAEIGDDVSIDEIKPLIETELSILDRLQSSTIGTGTIARQRTLVGDGNETMDALREHLTASTRVIDAEITAARAAREEARDRAGMSLLAIVVLSLAALAGGMWLLSTNVVRRVQLASENARRLPEGLELVPTRPGADEIGRLGQAIERTAELLAAQERAREKTEVALRESEQRMLRLMEDLPIAVFVTDSSGSPIYSNRLSLELLGLSADPSVKAENLSDVYRVFVAGTDQPYPTERLPVIRALSGKATNVEDIEIGHPSGRTIPLQVWGTPIKGPDDQVEYALAAFMDITERREAEAAIRESERALKAASATAERARRAAEAANQAKSDFLSRMSHELRTPLNSIMGFSQLLELDELHPDHRESVKHITKAGRHLLDLINEVLDLARIEAGRFSISLEPVAVHDVIEECTTMIRPLAVERELSIVSDTGATQTGTYAMADRQRLKQILLNLLSNAVKYNRRGGRIIISSTSTSTDRVEIAVVDTGLGIPSEKLHRLFTAFDRLGITDEQEQGTGLGLALSKRLAEVMGGDLTASSQPEKGSRFAIELGAAVAPIEQHEEMASPEPVRQASKTHSVILYIEDNVANVKLIERIFKRRPNVSLQTVMQGQLGLDLAREILPDLVLLDLNLPDMNGDEVLLRLRQDPATSSIPIVLLSADATERQITRMLEAGAAAYITKPINVATFLDTIDDVLMTGVADATAG